MAAEFDASGDYLSRSSPFSHNSAYTVSFYYQRLSGWVAYHHMFHVGGPMEYDANTDFFGLDSDGATSRAGCAGGTSNSFLTDATMTADQWYLIQMVRESDTSMKIYIDGTLTFTFTNDVSGRTAASLALIGNYNNLPCKGRIAAVKIWTSALDSTELAAEAGTYTAVKASPWAVWPLIDDFNDTSGNARHLTENGTVAFGEGPPFAAQLAGTASLALTSAASLTTQIQLAGTSLLALTASAPLSTAIPLLGTGTFTLTMSGELVTGIPLLGASVLSISAAGEIVTAIPLSAGALLTLDAVATLTGGAGAESGNVYLIMFRRRRRS